MTDEKTTAPFAAAPICALAAVVALAQLVAAIVGHGYWFDEVYMLAIGRHHLDWGSADQPPLTPAIAALSDWFFPNSVVALRIPAIVATAGAVVIAGMIAREFGCDRRAQVMVAAGQATALWITAAGHWLTPYTLEPVQWLVVFWLVARWIRLRDDRLLLWLGVAIGVAAMTKFQVLLLCAVTLCAVVAVGPRAMVRRPAFWVGAIIAAVIAAPTVVWQAVNGWPQLRMAPIVAEESGPLYGGRTGLAVTLVLFAGVALTFLMAYGGWRLLRSAELRDHRFLAVTVIALFAVFVASGGRPYYLGGGYAVLAAAGALGLQRRREAGRRRMRWVVWPAYAVGAALAVSAVVMGANLTRSDDADAIARHTADLYHGLPDDLRNSTAIVGDSYIVAAFLDGHSTRYDLPRAYSTTRSYGYFPPPSEDDTAMLFVGADPATWRPHFGEVRELGQVFGDVKAFLLTGRRDPWASLWEELRTLRVT